MSLQVFKKEKSFDDLPEDTVYIILEYLSVNTRLAILKNKYNKKIIKDRLTRLPKTPEVLDKLYKLVFSHEYLLRKIYHEGSDILYDNKVAGVTFRYKSKKYKNQHNSDEYKEMFIRIITIILENYTKYYNKNEGVKKTSKFEKKMFKLFAIVLLIK